MLAIPQQHLPFQCDAHSGRWRAGAPMDDHRFVAAVSPYITDMLHLTIVLVGASNAEDAAQEALLRAWRAAPTMRECGTIRPWLLRITANVCHDWRRGRQGTYERLTMPFPDLSEEVPAFQTPEDADPGSNAAALRLDLRRLVDLLEDDLRIVVVLRYYVEMNATEIGTTLGLPASTVRTRLQRALAQLRSLTEMADQSEAHLYTKVGP